MSGEKNPDLNDCFLAGLWLRDALAFLADIERHPDVPPDHWRLMLSNFTTARRPH